MKKFSVLLTLFLSFALILAECSPGETGENENLGTETSLGTSVAETPVAGGTLGTPAGTSELPNTGAQTTPTTGFGMTETETPSTGGLGTPAATEALGTVQSTEAVTGTGNLPNTGGPNPALVSNLLDYSVCMTNGTQMGSGANTGSDTDDTGTPSATQESSEAGESSQSGNQDQTKGEVKDLILDFRPSVAFKNNADNIVITGNGKGGRISYVVVGSGGFLGIGENDILVPWKAADLQLSSAGGMSANNNTNNNECIYLNQSAQALQNAPSIDLGTIDWQTTDWDSQVRTYWETELGDLNDLQSNAGTGVGATGTVTGTQTITGTGTITGSETVTGTGMTGAESANMSSNARLHRAFLASEVIGMKVQDTNGNDLGKVSDVVIDVRTGAILYFVLDTDSTVNIPDDQLLLVPASVFNMNESEDSFTIPTDAVGLQDAPTINKDELMNASHGTGWDTQMRTWWKDTFHPMNTP